MVLYHRSQGEHWELRGCTYFHTSRGHTAEKGRDTATQKAAGRPRYSKSPIHGQLLTELNSDPAGGYLLFKSICSRLTTGYPFASAAIPGSMSANRSAKNSQQIFLDSPSIKKLSLSTKHDTDGHSSATATEASTTTLLFHKGRQNVPHHLSENTV